MTYKYLKICLMGMIVLSFPSCDGIFDNIYDTPKTRIEVGFNNIDKVNHRGTLYTNATDYMQWIYVDLRNQVLDTARIDTINHDLVGAPENWDIALHRYDVKTNGASVIETTYTNMDAFLASGSLPEGVYVADVEDSVTVDMSHMMDNYIVMEKSPINKELGKWLNVDTSSMPPNYTLSNKVYVARFSDNTYAAFKLVNFMDENGTKGFMTVDYVYPLQTK